MILITAGINAWMNAARKRSVRIPLDDIRRECEGRR